jgi:hypothetical protein
MRRCAPATVFARLPRVFSSSMRLCAASLNVRRSAYLTSGRLFSRLPTLPSNKRSASDLRELPVDSRCRMPAWSTYAIHHGQSHRLWSE